jgi:SAM-dependent methyltransferase
MTSQNHRVLVNLGCGLHAPSGWINIDGSWSAKIAKHDRLKRLLNRAHVLPSVPSGCQWSPNIWVANLCRPLPFTTESVDAVYSSHLLEHLHVEDAKLLAKEIYRILRSGGICRLLVPDGAVAIRDGVLRELSQSDYAHPVPRIDAKARRAINGGLASEHQSLLRQIWGRINDFHSHKYLYNEKSLIALLYWSGFATAEGRLAFESSIPEIHSVELSNRSCDGSLCVEAIK